MAKMKVQVTIDDELLERLDNYADDNYLNRSAVVTIAVSQYLTAREMQSAISSLSRTMKKIAEEGEISEDEMKQLNDFERLARMFGNNGQI